MLWLHVWHHISCHTLCTCLVVCVCVWCVWCVCGVCVCCAVWTHSVDIRHAGCWWHRCCFAWRLARHVGWSFPDTHCHTGIASGCQPRPTRLWRRASTRWARSGPASLACGCASSRPRPPQCCGCCSRPMKLWRRASWTLRLHTVWLWVASSLRHACPTRSTLQGTPLVTMSCGVPEQCCVAYCRVVLCCLAFCVCELGFWPCDWLCAGVQRWHSRAPSLLCCFEMCARARVCVYVLCVVRAGSKSSICTWTRTSMLRTPQPQTHFGVPHRCSPCLLRPSKAVCPAACWRQCGPTGL